MRYLQSVTHVCSNRTGPDIGRFAPVFLPQIQARLSSYDDNLVQQNSAGALSAFGFQCPELVAPILLPELYLKWEACVRTIDDADEQATIFTHMARVFSIPGRHSSPDVSDVMDVINSGLIITPDRVHVLPACHGQRIGSGASRRGSGSCADGVQG